MSAERGGGRCRACLDWVPLCDLWGGEGFGVCAREVDAKAGAHASAGAVLDAAALVARPTWSAPLGANRASECPFGRDVRGGGE